MLNRTAVRGLLFVALLLFVMLLAVDLLRADSLLRSAWDALADSRSFVRRVLDGIRREGPAWQR